MTAPNPDPTAVQVVPATPKSQWSKVAAGVIAALGALLAAAPQWVPSIEQAVPALKPIGTTVLGFALAWTAIMHALDAGNTRTVNNSPN